jgi:DME family drug/metabolite transporter
LAAAEAAAAAMLWGNIGVAYRLGLAHGASPAWLILGRPLAASLYSLAALLLGAGRPTRWSVAVGLLGLAPLYATYFLAVQEVGAAMASILLYTAPVWVTILSPLAGDRAGARGLALAALGLLGVVLLVEPWGSPYRPLGVALGLASGASYAAYMLLARLGQMRGARPEEVSVHAFPFAALGVAAVVRPASPPGAADLAFTAYLAVLGTIVPYMLSARALARLEAHRVAVVSLVEPLTAVLLAALILGERLSSLQLLGAALVAAAALGSARQR